MYNNHVLAVLNIYIYILDSGTRNKPITQSKKHSPNPKTTENKKLAILILCFGILHRSIKILSIP